MAGARAKPKGGPRKPATKPPGGIRSPDIEVDERVRFAVRLWCRGHRDREILEQLAAKYGKSERTHREDLRRAHDQVRRDWAIKDERDNEHALAFQRSALLGVYRGAMDALDAATQAAADQGVVLDPRVAAQVHRTALQALDQLAELNVLRPTDKAAMARAHQDDVVAAVVNDGLPMVKGWIDQLMADGGLAAVLGRDLQKEAEQAPAGGTPP